MAVLGLLLSAEPEVESCHAKDLFIWFPWCIANTILSGFIARGGATARGTSAWLCLLEPHVILISTLLVISSLPGMCLAFTNTVM